METIRNQARSANSHWSKDFQVFAQKLPSGHECAARRHIKIDPGFGFCYEPPGDDELPPGGVMQF
ncbi:hypothetical protein DEO72_LG7g61 [Vigna unguiculata]|uniref:Uncharacterized protein n=1 Tax=Vigna unguiculata TaxID=3917 RepID=A0A4D6MG75_VIGUN|nr:hypothetical protein DEO72_LG7g61 [Vigna unguiculata]